MIWLENVIRELDSITSHEVIELTITFLPMILLFMTLNWLRGGSYKKELFPGRPVFLCSFIILVVSTLYFDWGWWDSAFGYSLPFKLPFNDGIVFGLGYLFWGIFEWGRWYDLNHKPELTRKKKPLEVIIEKISFKSDYISFFIRMCFASPFLFYFSTVEAIMFPLMATFSYWVAWKIDSEHPIPKAELFVGLLWGLTLTEIVLIGI